MQGAIADEGSPSFAIKGVPEQLPNNKPFLPTLFNLVRAQSAA
jgi:hypothetical protein